VIRWHRRGWRLYWTWRSRARLGRPRLSPEVRALIGRMAFENPTWGTQRIRGELLKLGITVSARSIRRYRTRTSNRPPSQTWRTFLGNQAKGIWAADLLVVQTIGFRTLYVLFFVSHARRELMYLNVTASPAAAWVWQQPIKADSLESQARPLDPRPRQGLRQGLRHQARSSRRHWDPDSVSGAEGQRDRGETGREPPPRVLRPHGCSQRGTPRQNTQGVCGALQPRSATPQSWSLASDPSERHGPNPAGSYRLKASAWRSSPRPLESGMISMRLLPSHTHHQALRALANRLVEILHGCLDHRQTYREEIAWPGSLTVAA
jgi:hypothetical protein